MPSGMLRRRGSAWRCCPPCCAALPTSLSLAVTPQPAACATTCSGAARRMPDSGVHDPERWLRLALALNVSTRRRRCLSRLGALRQAGAAAHATILTSINLEMKQLEGCRAHIRASPECSRCLDVDCDGFLGGHDLQHWYRTSEQFLDTQVGMLVCCCFLVKISKDHS